MVLFTSLFRYVFISYSYGVISPFKTILNAIDIALNSVIISVFLQILPPVNWLFTSIKPNNIQTSDLGLMQSYRGLSGLMPEPSYVGTCLAILFISSFLLGFFSYLSGEISSTPGIHVTSGYPRLIGFSSYARYCQLFIKSQLFRFVGSIVAVFLAFSPTSILCYFLILSSIFIPFLIQAFSGIVRREFFKYVSLIAFIGLLFFLFSSTFFAQSRIATYLNPFLLGDLGKILLIDQSVADRYASSALGLSSLFSYPFGLGLNGHGFLMSDCTNQLILSLDLMCGSIFNSGRNHNAIANIIIDGGFVSLLLFYYLYSSVSCIRTFFKSASFHSCFKYSIFAFSVFILFLFILLPAPLGAPFVWLPFSLSLILIRSLPDLPLIPKTDSLHQ